MELGLAGDGGLSMRNVHFESHAGALAARGGVEVPALWDGSALHRGLAAVLAALDRLARDGAAPRAGGDR